ncbi:C39 family peptidase [Demetria terragena]|uniref:C39 family peptidase n=1 Tax=Demetria terragena TaxID=63959 RepID=UPI0012EA407B|nr:C39 family peptidase [Demetria terragena]
MSDRCTRQTTTGVPQPTFSRRVVLGAGLVVGGLAHSAEMTAASAQSATAPAEREIHLQSFRCAAHWARGKCSGVAVSQGQLVIASPSTTRSYTDPHADSGAATVWEAGAWTSPRITVGFPATEVIASWNVDTPPGTWVEVAVQGATTGGEETEWLVVGRWSSANPAEGGAIHRTSVDDQEGALASVKTDTVVFEGGNTLASYFLRITLMRRTDSDCTPRVAQLTGMASALPDGAVTTSTPGKTAGTVLDVPTLSQEVHVGHYPEWDNGGEAWCSPTSVAMIADYWKRGPSAKATSWVTVAPDEQVDHAARQSFDHEYQGCGNWPFNVAYAATLGLRGYVTRLRSLRDAEAYIAAGIPLVMSVSFKKEDMPGAGYSTSGHLMVLCGFTAAGNPVINDPASHLIPSNNEVRVTYDRAAVENAWLPHSGGLVYAIYPEGTQMPKNFGI